MTIPGWRDWAFAIKTFAAAMLALYPTFAIGSHLVLLGLTVLLIARLIP